MRAKYISPECFTTKTRKTRRSPKKKTLRVTEPQRKAFDAELAKPAEHSAPDRFGGRREAAARPGTNRDTSRKKFPLVRLSVRSRTFSLACASGRSRRIDPPSSCLSLSRWL